MISIVTQLTTYEFFASFWTYKAQTELYTPFSLSFSIYFSLEADEDVAIRATDASFSTLAVILIFLSFG